MNIFDAHISGSLSVSSSAEISGDLTVLGTLNATVSGTTTNALTASEAPKYTLTSSFGAFTSSYTTGSFTGSFKGDGSGLNNIPASGVTGLNLNKIISGSVSASISPNRGLEVNTDATFTGSVNITGSIYLNGNPIGTGKLDETTFNLYTSSIITYTGNTSTTIATLSTTSSVNSLSSSIATTDLNQTNRLNSIETSTGSLNTFTSSINTTIKSKLNSDSVVSGAIQVNITGTTGYSTFSSSLTSSIGSLSSSVATTTSGLSGTITNLSSSVATTDLNQTNRLNSIENITGSYATTGSNLFKGTQTHSGSILPSVDNTYDLGSVDYQWRDVYISSGSLYIDGTKVISSTAQELVITTDNGQSIKILEGTTDSIILQTADGDIELKSSGDGDILLDPTNGKITLKGTVEVLNGSKIQSSVGGTPIVFSNDIVVSGSIDITGTIEGINLTDFSSSVNTRLGNLEGTTVSLNSYTSSNTTNINAIHTATSSLNSFTSSINTTIKSKLNSDGVISGSIQVSLSNTTGYSTFSSSLATTDSGQDSRLNSLESTTASINTYTSSNNSTNTTQNNRLTALETSTSSLNSFTSSASTKLSLIETSTGSLNTFSGSAIVRLGLIETSTGSLNSFTSSAGNRLSSIEGKTGSYATTGSNIFLGNQTITGSLYVTQDLIIGGSSSIQNISSSVLNIGDNIITVNAVNPSVRFGGLAVIDSGSSPQVSGSILFDSVNNQWLFVHQNQGTVTSSVLLMGPETYNNVGNESYITQNKIIKSTGIEHLSESNITDTGTKVSINSNTEITGTFVATGTALISGSSQITHNSTTGYVANQHIDHTSVSITAGNGLSGGGDISTTRTVSLDTTSATFTSGVKTKMSADGVISGSLQVVASLPSGTVSGSSQVLNGSGVWSGSAQLPSGVVSGSSQVLLGTTIHSGTFFNGVSVVSGSGQISFNGITDKPTLVSGSSQITYGSLSGIPSGIVSGSSQITFGSISGIPGGLVSGSSQIDLTATTNYSTGIKTRLNTEGVISGSSQITLSSTTGYGSVLNQSVLTTSTPTFAELTLNSNQDGKLTLRVPSSGDTNDWNYINFVGANGTRDMYFGTDSGGNPTWYRDDNGVNIGLGSVATVNGTQIVTNSGTWAIGISGNAATVTNGVYTTSDQSIGGIKTFTNRVVFNSAVTNRPQFPGGILGLDTGDGNFDIWGISRDYYPSHGTAANAWGLRWNGDNNDFEFVGGGTNRVILDMDGGNITSTGTISASNYSGTHSGTSSGTNTGDQTNISGNAATVTNGVYTTGDQTIGGTKTFSSTIAGSINGSAAQLNGQGQAYYFSTANMDASRNILASTNLDTDLENGGAYGSYGAGGTSWNSPFSYGGVMAYAFTSGIRAQFGFDIRHNSSDYGNLWYRTKNNLGYSTWRTMWHNGNLTNLNQLTNGPGYITSITSANVTTALGYTPYNATNPNGYITGISYANVSSKPTTLSGYGITDALTNDSDSEQTIGGKEYKLNFGAARMNIDPRWNESGYDADLGTLHIWAWTAGGVPYGRAGLALYNGSAYQYITTKASTTGVFINNTQIVTNSGTWAISTTGNAATAGGLSVHSDRNNEVNKIVRTDVNGYIQAGWINTTSGDNGTSALTRIYASDDAYLRYYTPTNFRQVLDVPTRTGGSASGNWGINVTGTANNITAYTINQSVGTGNLPTFAGVKGSSYFDAQASSGFRIRNSTDTANAGGWSRRGLWEGNSNYDPALWAETGYGLYFYTNGSATIKTWISPNGSLLHGHTAVPSEAAWLGTAVFGRDGYNKVIIGSLNSTTIGAYIGGHNSALTAWSDINIAGENLIFRYQQTEIARFNTSGHLTPGSNGVYNLGSSSLRWNTVFTSDLSLSNGIGDYTIVEGEEKLYLYNNKNNKVYSFVLQEEDPTTATPKKS